MARGKLLFAFRLPGKSVKACHAIFWYKIRHNAIKFSRDWTGAKSERAEKQTF
jgi:hypothetical protein